MTVRKCSTCKYYEPAPIWRKGWCRNPLLYSPQQSHLVGEDDLDCDKGMGNYWEPADGVAGVDDPGFGSVGYEHERGFGAEPDPEQVTDVAFAPVHDRDGIGDEAPALVAPVAFAGLRRKAGDSGNGGDEMGQYPPTGTRRPFGEDDDDEDLAPRGGRFGDGGRAGLGGPGGGGPGGPGGGGQFNYNPDERYWTDYVRIALPVIGVILLLALAWFWINSLIGGKSSTTPTAVTGSSLPPIMATPSSSTPTVTSQITRVTASPTGASTTSASASPTAITGATKLGPNVAAVVSGTGGTGVNMRAKPSTSAEIVAKLAEGTKVTVTGDSVAAEGYTWWPVKTDSGNGYMVADYLKPSP